MKLFLGILESYVTPSSRILDIGAGAGKNHYAFKGRVKEIVGVDLDPRVEQNPLLDKGVVADAGTLPFESNSFDVAFSIYVLEHVEKPIDFVAEVRRVLKPGGLFLTLTPNRYHYVPMLASLTPTRFHKWFNRSRGRNEADTFPTVYRMNTERSLRRYFAAGFDCIRVEMVEVAPNYLRFWMPAYFVGAMYERLVNRFRLLKRLRVNIVAVFKKRIG